MNTFKTYHPLVNLAYFVCVIGFSCTLMHPGCLGISLPCAICYAARLKDASLRFLIPMMLITALINPAFNHRGMTVLAYLPSGNPLTLESILYGLCAAAMLASVILYFSCFNRVMTSDKLLFLFGKIIPALSLIASMTLRFVPRFFAQFKVVSDAQKCIGRDASRGGILTRAKNGLNILSIVTTWALENAVDTADSMNARGYGLPGRSAFSIFAFDKRDKAALITLLLLSGYVLFGALCGAVSFRFFPELKPAQTSAFGISVWLCYLTLCSIPMMIEIWEVRKWKALQSKI